MKSLNTRWLVALLLAGVFGINAAEPTTSPRKPKDASSVSDSFIPFRWLDDATYDAAVLQCRGLARVIFLGGQELELLSQVGQRTNRMQTFVVNISTNQTLREKLWKGQLGNIDAGATSNGQPVIHQRTPCWVLLFRGASVASGEVWESRKSSFWLELDKGLAESLYGAVESAGHAYNKKVENERQKAESERSREDVTINFGKKTDQTVALLGEAVAQDDLFARAGWQSPAMRALDVLGHIDPPEAAIPVLLSLLGMKSKQGDWKRDLTMITACHALARIGSRLPEDRRTPLVAPLTKLAEQFVTNPKQSGEGSNIQPGVAAIQALGALGPVSKPAAPILARFAEKVYPHAIQPEFAGDHELGDFIGLLTSYCLARIEPPAPPRDATARIRGKGLNVMTGRRQATGGAKKALILFWNGRNCYTAICDDQGKYDIKLPPGTYVCGWASDQEHLLFTADAQRCFSNLLVVKARAGATETLNVPISTIFVD